MALPYAPEALEPVISKETIGFHHGKQLAGYVNSGRLLTGRSSSSDTYNYKYNKVYEEFESFGDDGSGRNAHGPDGL